jgi:hypothetical protein
MATTDELERRIAALEARFPKSMAGPIANSLNVAQIGYSPSAASSMFLNMIGNVAGVAPRLSVTDASKVVRAEIGNLAANGSSPAQFGFRANDASGSPIFDSLGLIAAATVLVNHVNTSGANLSGGATPGDYLIDSTTFTLTRQLNVLLLAIVNGNITSTANPFTFGPSVFMQVTGQTATYKSAVPTVSGAGQTLNVNQDGCAICHQVLNLPAATYTLNGYWHNFNNNGVTTLNWDNIVLFALQLGS